MVLKAPINGEVARCRSPVGHRPARKTAHSLRSPNLLPLIALVAKRRNAARTTHPYAASISISASAAGACWVRGGACSTIAATTNAPATSAAPM